LAKPQANQNNADICNAVGQLKNSEEVRFRRETKVKSFFVRTRFVIADGSPQHLAIVGLLIAAAKKKA
jgi:hypothetical protein